MACAASVVAGCAEKENAKLPFHQLNLDGRRPAWRPTMARQVEVKQEVRPVPVKTERKWRYIVVHHSATDGGNAEVFDKLHRGPQFGFDELGYHFVITNGQGGPDGLVQTGSRWHKQKWGAHTGGTPGNEYNNYGIGICLVGNFTDHMPSAAQIDSLRRLVVRLMIAYDIPAWNVIGHRDAPNAATECPGGVFHAYLVGSFRRQIGQQVTAAKDSGSAQR